VGARTKVSQETTAATNVVVLDALSISVERDVTQGTGAELVVLTGNEFGCITGKHVPILGISQGTDVAVELEVLSAVLHVMLRISLVTNKLPEGGAITEDKYRCAGADDAEIRRDEEDWPGMDG